MKEHRIYIIGASGTGKTTLAKAVADKLKIPQFDSDDFYHYPTDPPYSKQRSPEERVRLLFEALNPNPSWILSGGAGTWKPPIQLNFTLAVFLSLPIDIRLARLKERESRLYGSRILDGGDMNQIHQEFMSWTKGYDDGSSEGTNTRPAHEEFLLTAAGPVLRIEKPLTTEKQLALLLESLKS